MSYCNCYQAGQNRNNPSDREGWQQELRMLEADYWHQTAFHRKSDLVEINRLRAKLELPPVDDRLQVILIDLPVVEEILAPPPKEPSIVASLENKDDLLRQVSDYTAQLGLSELSFKSRVREYLKVNKPIETLSYNQLQDLITALQQELAKKIEGQRLLRDYAPRGSTKRAGFSLEVVNTLRCAGCGKAFPIEGGPWTAEQVPFIHGGLMLFQDEKGAVDVYHGYENQPKSCYGKAVKD